MTGATPEDEHAVALEANARALAETHRELERVKRLARRLRVRSLFGRALDRALKRFGGGTKDPDRVVRKAGEWFLDNFYLIRRTARQVDEELPRGFLMRLPLVASGPTKGMPRIEALARALVGQNAELDTGLLRRFIDAYQEVSPLTIAELWAFPTLLRATVLQDLLKSLTRLQAQVMRESASGTADEAGPTRTEGGVERAVRALRLFAEVDWKTFFQNGSRIDAILRTDPAEVYPRMDFETCDAYRKAAEELAWGTAKPEPEVAEAAMLSLEAPTSRGEGTSATTSSAKAGASSNLDSGTARAGESSW